MFALALTREAEVPPPGHAGFLVGQYRDGAYSDAWTDVSRCAEGTFVGYAPACSCGWRGAPQSATAAGRLWCARLWRDDHVARLDPLPRAVAS